MAEFADYYKMLGVTETVSPPDLKKAYRLLARRYHPDQNAHPEAQRQFRMLHQAYQVLSNEETRKQYDRERRNPMMVNGGFMRRIDMFSDGMSDLTDPAFGSSPASHAFAHLFQEKRRATGRNADDVSLSVRIPFDLALRGGHTEVQLQDGTAMPLAVPRGTRPGLKVRIRGRGPARPGSRDCADLYVTFQVEPSARFRREGDDLHISETVTVVEALLGTSRSIVNAYGKTVRVQVPAGTQPGERLRLRGQGVQTKTGNGDMYVEVRMSVPRNMTAEQRAELEKCVMRIGLT